jgi:ubiquinone/menaquinone biosynthesis C-methylase UbiE
MTAVGRFRAQKDLLRGRLLKYTRRAFRMLPHLDRPRILDIGCGSGIPTLELAKLSQGEVTGVDVDQAALNRLADRARKAGMGDRVRALNCSMFEMSFPDQSYDIIWSEGAIYPIGFERGLREWRRLLKPGGFMVVHDEQGNVEEKLVQIARCGYDLLGYFLLSQETWWQEYFAPLERLVDEFQARHAADPAVCEELGQARRELDMFNKSPERNSSVYFVLKKSP